MRIVNSIYNAHHIDNAPISPKIERTEILPRAEDRWREEYLWRDPDGPEVDWIVVAENRWLPVEVKWSEAPAERDARHLKTFLSEYPQARAGVIVCRTPRRFKIGPKVTAVPWQEIPELVTAMA